MHKYTNNYNECSNSMRNNGINANPVMPADIMATVIPRPISDLKNALIVIPPLALLLVIIIPIKYFKSFTLVYTSFVYLFHGYDKLFSKRRKYSQFRNLFTIFSTSL